MAISLEHANILGLIAWQLRKVEALPSHFGLVEGHAPEHNVWSENLLQVVWPEYVVWIWIVIFESAVDAAEWEPPLNVAVASERLQRRHIIVHLKEDIQGQAEQ